MHAPPTAPRLVHVAAAAPRRPAAVSLLDLPIEVIDLIVRWVALLRYDYSESRRPVPSALHHVACGTNKLLRRVALPYLFRTWQSRSDSHRRVWVPGARGLVDTREFVRTWRQPRDDTGRVDDPRSLPRLESLVFFELPEVGAPDVPFPSVTHVEVRRGQRDRARAWFGRLPALTSCTISDPQAHLLPVLHTRPRLVDLAVTVEPTTRIDMDNPVWPQLRRLEVQVVKPRAGGGSAPVLNPLAFLLETIRYPTTDIQLRHLSLSVRLDPHLRSDPKPMSQVVGALAHAFASVPLVSLALDEYTTCTPEDLSALATAFPALESLSLPDRTIWNGSRADLLAALSPLTALTTLSCRLLPDTPSSAYDDRDSDDSDDADADSTQYASPRSIALEAASALPRLALVGFIGQHTAIEWMRVRRKRGDAQRAPQEVERVRVVETGLERP